MAAPPVYAFLHGGGLAPDSVAQPEPDVCVAPRDPHAYRDAHPSRAALVVEIAETSYRTDRDYDAVEIHREPEASSAARYGWRYRSVETLRSPAVVRPLVAPEAGIRVADLLP